MPATVPLRRAALISASVTSCSSRYLCMIASSKSATASMRSCLCWLTRSSIPAGMVERLGVGRAEFVRVDDGLLGHQVHVAGEGVFGADGQLDRDGARA